MPKLFALLSLLLCVACAADIQTTSGRDYIARSGGVGLIDADIAKAAAVEPQLRFPARIGVARIVNGQLTAIPEEEAAALLHIAQARPQLGQFVPVSPLVVGLVAQTKHRFDTEQVIKNIRLGAARQHLDHVLIYEVGARSQSRATALALTDVTLIGGALLPTRKVRVQGVAQALFVNVRNGYPYGTASAQHDLSGLARGYFVRNRKRSLEDQAVLAVVKALIPELETLLDGLLAAADKP